MGAESTIGPNDLFVGRNFENLNALLGTVARDDRVAIGKSLAAAWVDKWLFGEVVIGDLPQDLSLRIHFDRLVPMGKIDDRVPIG